MTTVERDKYLAKKYINGRDIDLEDHSDLKEMRGDGFMHIGMSFRRQVLTAKTTRLGRMLCIGAPLRREVLIAKITCLRKKLL